MVCFYCWLTGVMYGADGTAATSGSGTMVFGG